MATIFGQGNFINGSFISEGTITVTSKNPSFDYEPVFSVKTDLSHVDLAVESANKAYRQWTYQSQDQRIKALESLKHAFKQNESAMANAISQEMGKILSEALTEAKSLSARIELMIEHGIRRVRTETLYDLRAETRYHNQGVLAVIGPYNFPAHLVNAHVIPSILLGNTVVIKPSELCPMVAEIYAKSVKESLLPPGVINIVHGDGRFGRALCLKKDIQGVLFTGSYKTGRALKELLLDDPHKILALEMGGKNFAVVMDDADIKQALLEIVQGAYLTTGQRCTATSRVLVHEKIFDRFKNTLIKIVKDLKPVKANEVGLFGPMASKDALDHFLHGLSKAKEEGAEVLVESDVLKGGAFVTPSIYHVKKTHPLNFYLGEELFGPNICLEDFFDLDEAIARINQSPYGLSNAIFTLDPKNSERMILETRSGVLNINRSTNNALGQMPFGGVAKSGNQRPAGIDAVRYATFPIAITSLAYGESAAPKELKDKLNNLDLGETSLEIITLRHEVEGTFETYGIYCDFSALDRICFARSSFDGLFTKDRAFFNELSKLFGEALSIEDGWITFYLLKIKDRKEAMASLTALLQTYAEGLSLSLKKTKTLGIHVPSQLKTPRSRAMLDRLYLGNFVPQEKKILVADLERSRGAFLASVDDDPLVIFDAASQIATLGAGYLADTFQNAYDCHDLDLAIQKNCNLALPNSDENSEYWQDAIYARKELENFLHKKSEGNFRSIAYGASGAEANEIAFDLCRQNGLLGTRILAFEGSFHGRTIMTLQATFNKEKRGPFSFKDYEACFLPFPELKNPKNQPEIPPSFLEALGKGDIPNMSSNDALLHSELKSLQEVKREVLKGNICCVIIEPMQCEGGDRYASNRFFSGLRALTRALKVPLIFDEVQTGFNLGREFFWYQQLNLVDEKGHREFPDCVTLAKKAQLGICMSIWQNSRDYMPHVVQLKRGLLHAKAIDKNQALLAEQKALKELETLNEHFPELVLNPRACGFAFAFDMPSKEIANVLIDQRFVRGFMVYIAGERTLRFRLNMVAHDDLIDRLFERLFVALIDIRDNQLVEKITKSKKEAPSSRQIEDVTFELLTKHNFDRYAADIENIENSTYEEGRRDTMAFLKEWLSIDQSLGLLMKCKIDNQEIIAGYAIGGPLEYSKCAGPKDDANRGKDNSFYSANITIDHRVRGLGLGRMLKNEQIRLVASMKKDTHPRYLFMTGRNRVGFAQAMNQINENLGAYVVSIEDNQYNEKGAKAAYYRLPIMKSMHPEKRALESNFLDCRNNLEEPFLHIPDTFLHDLNKNRFRSFIGSKLTLSNWATPNMVRYSELLRKTMPKHLKHAYFTSGRDEVIDKGLRSLRFYRPDADIAIGFTHQWLGNITAAARSLSHNENQAQPFEFFSWPKILHPSIAGIDASLKNLRDVLTTLAHARVLGIVVELFGEKSGLTFDEKFIIELDGIRKSTGIPLVFVENASSLGRSGHTVFLSDHLPIKANMVLWYTGGQLGHIFVDDEYFVEKPLTLISTWDGDELSMARAYHNLLKASSTTWQAYIHKFDQAMKALKSKDEHHGYGTWHSVRCKDPSKLQQAIKTGRDHSVLFGHGFDSALMVCPKPDFSASQFDALIEVVKKVI